MVEHRYTKLTVRMSKVLQLMLMTTVVAIGFHMFCEIRELLIGKSPEDFPSLDAWSAAWDANARLRAHANLAYGVSLVLGTIMTLLWVFRAYRACQELGATMRFSPGWAVAYWFIPILNLFRPYQVMCDLWEQSAAPRARRKAAEQVAEQDDGECSVGESEQAVAVESEQAVAVESEQAVAVESEQAGAGESEQAQSPDMRRGEIFIALWWGGWLTAVLLGVVADAMYPPGSATLDTLRSGDPVHLIQQGVEVATTIATMWLVARLTGRIQARSQGLAPTARVID